MARDTTREPSSTTQQSGTKTQQNQQDTKEGSTQLSQSERERAIESGRDSDRQGRFGTGVVRQRGGAPVYRGANSPFAVMQRMAEDMDRLFEQFGFGRLGFGVTPRLGSWLDDEQWSERGTQAATLWSPQVETFRRGDKLVVRADIPGVKKDDIHVEIENDMLTISGERKEQQEEDRDGFFRSERSYGRFYRAIPLPEGASSDQVNATFEDGVLEVTLPAPKQEERKAKRIQVK